MLSQLKLSDSTKAQIEWDMTPDLAFCTFTAKGLRKGLTNTDERVCYFFVDNYEETPRLFLVERGTRYVNILAEIKAPLKMMNDCIINHGCPLSTKDNFPINNSLKTWLQSEVLGRKNSPFLVPTLSEETEQEDFGSPLQPLGQTGFNQKKLALPFEHITLSESEIKASIKQWGFYDSTLNPQGNFENALADTGNTLILVDERTGLMWQKAGLDLCSIRQMNKKIEQLNKNAFAGFNDWRMPSMEEAMSLLEKTQNTKGLFLHPCFSKNQPFIFVAAKRSPTGYWFVDYKQGKIYWSSGTVPGGFGKLCRKVLPNN